MFDKRINIIRLVLGVMAFGLGFLCNRIVGIVLETNPQIVATDIANTKVLAVRQKRFLKSGSLYDYKQLEDYYDALDISGDVYYLETLYVLQIYARLGVVPFVNVTI